MTPEKRLNQLEPIVADIAQKQDRMIGQIGMIADEIAIVKTDVAAIRTAVANAETDIADLKTDVSTLKTDVSTLKADVSILKVDVSTLKTDVADIKNDIVGIKTDALRVERKTDSVAAGLANLTLETRQGFDVVGGRLTRIEGDVSEIKQTQTTILKLLQEKLS